MLPTIAGAMTLDSWFNSRKESFRDKYAEKAIAEGHDREQALQYGLQPADISRATLEQKLYAISDRLETSTKEVNDCSSNLEIINNHLNNGGLTTQEIVRLN